MSELMNNVLNDDELNAVAGGAGGKQSGAEMGSKTQNAKQQIPMTCNDGKCKCSEIFYISGHNSVVQCPYCKHLYVING